MNGNRVYNTYLDTSEYCISIIILPVELIEYRTNCNISLKQIQDKFI